MSASAEEREPAPLHTARNIPTSLRNISPEAAASDPAAAALVYAALPDAFVLPVMVAGPADAPVAPRAALRAAYARAVGARWAQDFAAAAEALSSALPAGSAADCPAPDAHSAAGARTPAGSLPDDCSPVAHSAVAGWADSSVALTVADRSAPAVQTADCSLADDSSLDDCSAVVDSAAAGWAQGWAALMTDGHCAGAAPMAGLAALAG